MNINYKKIRKVLDNIIKFRNSYVDRLVIVNKDVTPENITINKQGIGIIDPFPSLDFDIKYASFFVFCYDFLLESYSQVPRYIHNNFISINNILKSIACGFVKGYTNGDETLINKVKVEYFLWILEEAYMNFGAMNSNLSNKTIIKMGNKDIINKRFGTCLYKLEEICNKLEFT